MNPMRTLLLMALSTLVLGLAACSVLPKNEPVTLDRYTLQVDVPTTGAAASTDAPVLLIARPKIRSDLDSPRIAYREQDYDIRFFARSRWADSPAELLMPGLLEAFEASGRYAAVLRNGIPVTTDLRLESELLDFSQDFRVKPSVFHLRMRVQLVDLNQRRVIASRIFAQTQPAPAASPYGGVQAANRAWQALLPEIVAFATRHTPTTVAP